MERRSSSDKPPENKEARKAGLEEALKNTKKTIEEYQTNGADASEFEKHLDSLKRQLSELNSGF